MQKRTFIKTLSLIGLSPLFRPLSHLLPNAQLIHRTIPSTKEKIPVIGMGSWLTFDVKGSQQGMQNMKQVLQTFYKQGGRVLDSSPMYGSSEEVIGVLAKELNILLNLWVSTKVWTNGKQSGLRQMNNSNRYFGQRVKVNHVHNIRDFKIHYQSLLEAKAKGDIKYIGVTHYLNSAHDELANLIKKYDLDFVQFNYNIENPNAAQRLLPTARDCNTATIINRPFQTGHLFNSVKNEPLPKWAKEMGIETWAAYFLKYIISHNAVTCAIPATTQVAHVLENMEAGQGYLPTNKEREKMYRHFKAVK